MENTSAHNMLSFREEVEIGVMISSELMDLIQAGHLDSSEVRTTLREVVAEVGIGHTDRALAEMTVHSIRHELAGRF